MENYLKESSIGQEVEVSREYKKIKQMLFDLVLMVEDLKVLAKEQKQGDVIQLIYDILGKVDSLSE